MHYVYILQSLKGDRTYVGQTKNLIVRLRQHNSGSVTSTKYRRPFKLLFSETFGSVQEAKEKELWWKSSSGRKKMREFF